MATLHQQCAKRVIANAHLMINMNAHIGYTWSPARWSGINGHVHPPHVPPWADCSSATTYLFWEARVTVRGSAGADIVNGLNWKAGNTATQINHGRRHKLGSKAWIPGRTLLFYGGKVITHVTLWLGLGKVFSHGTQTGPKYLDWDYRHDFRFANAYAL